MSVISKGSLLEKWKEENQGRKPRENWLTHVVNLEEQAILVKTTDIVTSVLCILQSLYVQLG